MSATLALCIPHDPRNLTKFCQERCATLRG